MDKLPIYAREHVGFVWFVDPLERTLEVLGLENGRWVVLGAHRDDARVRALPFEAFELALAVLWEDLTPSP